MPTFEEVEALCGHAVGGVCPFAVNEGVVIYLDESLRRFETVYPACGSSNSAIELTINELEMFAKTDKWIDVCNQYKSKDLFPFGNRSSFMILISRKSLKGLRKSLYPEGKLLRSFCNQYMKKVVYPLP